MRLHRPASPMCVMRTRRAKRADKPGSVEDGHLSRRACLHAAPRTLPGRGPGRPMAPLFALAPDGVYQAAVLPRRWWSLTPPFQLFPLRHAVGGSLLFCGTDPSGCPAWPLASILPCGARTFLTPKRTFRSRDRLARFAKGIIACRARARRDLGRSLTLSIRGWLTTSLQRAYKQGCL